MEQSIKTVHERIFLYLRDRSANNNLKFGVRKSNRESKLEQGYWFYGNEHYLGVSFWTGMDWKNRTPNIFFAFSKRGECWIEISVSDSQKKYEFVSKHLVDQLDFESVGQAKWIKRLSSFGEDYIAALDYFISRDKPIIDDVITNGRYFFESIPDEAISIIDDADFRESLSKIDYYRTKSRLEYTSDWDIDEHIDGFQIRNFGPIVDTTFINIKSRAQWIFLTGENGTGKTSLLKAIACGICHVKTPEAVDAYFKFNFNSKHSIYERFGNSDTSAKKPLLSGFCAYGASRLVNSQSKPRNFSLLKTMSKNGLVASLFNSDTVLIDIQDQLNYWLRSDDLRHSVEKRKKFIRQVLVEVLPNVVDVRFQEIGDLTATLYVEKDEFGNEYPPVTFNQLASGLKSLVVMIGDMMMRLFNQQANIIDPSELAGIVIIDEIDIHLHPNLQKYLVEQLTATFPSVRFIVSTHSPIPMLGAPPGSQFIKVERSEKTGVELIDLSEIAVEHLLPNALLSSELFGMDKLFDRKSIELQDIRTENTIEEIELNDAVVQDLKQIAIQLRRNNENSE